MPVIHSQQLYMVNAWLIITVNTTEFIFTINYDGLNTQGLWWHYFSYTCPL